MHAAAQAHLPHARLTVDRFHVMKNLTQAVTKARRAIQKNADEARQQVLKGGRWLLIKNPDDLTETEQYHLAQMLAASPELKEAFWVWFNAAHDHATAALQLDEGLQRAGASGLNACKAFNPHPAQLARTHLELLRGPTPERLRGRRQSETQVAPSAGVRLPQLRELSIAYSDGVRTIIPFNPEEPFWLALRYYDEGLWWNYCCIRLGSGCTIMGRAAWKS